MQPSYTTIQARIRQANEQRSKDLGQLIAMAWGHMGHGLGNWLSGVFHGKIHAH
ncbi:MAG: hypothetical protein K9K38_10055 [Rhodoferax sp.]|nr:hypothetical protein [Rhodoferax sp.]